MTQKELTTKYPRKEFGEVNVKRNYQYPLTGKKNEWGGDERDFSETAQVTDKGWEFYLNHSCDEWVIGDLEAAQKFNNDLAEAIKYTQENP